VARRLDEPQRPLDLPGEKLVEKRAGPAPPLGVGEALAQNGSVTPLDRQLIGVVVKPGLQLRQLLVAHQHDEMDLR